MKKIDSILFILFFVTAISLQGCGHIREIAKTVWGSSTRALENARVDAIRKTYRCEFDACFMKVLEIIKAEGLEVFLEDKRAEHIVVMKVPGSIDTTEVGLFFSDLEDRTRIDITSLSSEAKKTVADIVFDKLAVSYKEILHVSITPE